MKKNANKTAATKTAAAEKGKARELIESMTATAKQAEDEVRYLDAAGAWETIASATAATKKERKEAAGRAAACRVRAEGLPRVERDEVPAAEPVIEYDAAAPAEVEPVIEVEPASEPIAAAEAALEAAQELVNAGGAEPAQDGADGADATPANTGAEAAAPAAPAKRARKAAEPKAPRARDPRLPPVWTVMQHTVRGKVLAECVETEAGEFIDRGLDGAGNMVELGRHPSIHKAAFAATQRLGLRNSGANGFRFYDLNERAAAPKRASRGKDHGAAITRTFAAYEEAIVEALAAAGEDAEARAAIYNAIEPHVTRLLKLAGRASA